jgi:hypothetical protein
VKKSVFFVLFALATYFSNAQETEKKWMYSVGAGPAIEGNHGMWGLNFTNELSYYLTGRVSINPSLTYFHTLTPFETHSDLVMPNQEDYMSSLFTNVKLRIDLIKSSKDFRIGLAAGPSFQLGGSSSHKGYTTQEQNPETLISMGYEVEKHARLGYVTEVNFDWRNAKPNRRSSASISMSSFSGYWPYYLMANYKFGFQL